MLVAVFASLLFLYSLVSRRRERTIVTAPIVFAVAGVLTFLIAPEILERKVAALDADAPEHKEMNE